MDAEALLNCESYAELCRLRDAALADLRAEAESIRSRICALAGDNRAGRRKTAGRLREFERLAQAGERKLLALFDRLAGDFDPETGMSHAVEFEATKALSDIL